MANAFDRLRFDVEAHTVEHDDDEGRPSYYGIHLTPRVPMHEMRDDELKTFGIVKCLYHVASCFLPRGVREAGSREEGLKFLKRYCIGWGHYSCLGGPGSFAVEGNTQRVTVKVGEGEGDTTRARTLKIPMTEVVAWALRFDDRGDPIEKPIEDVAPAVLQTTVAPMQLNLF